jgi:hypothetical protein
MHNSQFALALRIVKDHNSKTKMHKKNPEEFNLQGFTFLSGPDGTYYLYLFTYEIVVIWV